MKIDSPTEQPLYVPFSPRLPGNMLDRLEKKSGSKQERIVLERAIGWCPACLPGSRNPAIPAFSPPAPCCLRTLAHAPVTHSVLSSLCRLVQSDSSFSPGLSIACSGKPFMPSRLSPPWGWRVRLIHSAEHNGNSSWSWVLSNLMSVSATQR